MSSQGNRAWVFTINNILPGDDPKLWTEKDGHRIRYLVWQEEKGNHGTLHFQGYVLFEIVKKLSAVKKLSGRAHWEIRRGTHSEAKDYCTKEDTRVSGPFSFGESEEPASGSGGRSDLLAVKRKLDAGVSERDIAQHDDHFPTWCKNHRALQRYVCMRQGARRTWPVYTVVFHGPPGSGKSERVLEEAGADAFWVSKPMGNGGLWWDGYSAEENVVLDDFDGSWTTMNFMCRLLDRYPLTVNTKGGMVPFLGKRIWITSNKAPYQWWPNVGLGGVARRISGDLGRVEFIG